MNFPFPLLSFLQTPLELELKVLANNVDKPQAASSSSSSMGTLGDSGVQGGSADDEF